MSRWLPLLAATLIAAAARAEHYEFALIGDTPYFAAERAALPEMLEEIANRGAAFIIHVGDFKSGSAPCDDETIEDRARLFDASVIPFVFIPGDNDWLDCTRRSAGGYDPTERLERLRSRIHAGSGSLGQNRIALERQSSNPRFGEFREHVRWRHGPVLFLGLNVTGSHNGWQRAGVSAAQFERRSAAVQAWLDEAFDQASRDGLLAVVVFIQANPDFESANAGRVHPGYAAFLDQLRNLTLRFAGQVVLVHGDTHAQRIDRPLRDPASGAVVENFLRVETHGSPFMGWTRVSVDDASPTLLRFEAISYSLSRKEP